MRKCEKRGHIQRVCRSGKSQNLPRRREDEDPNLHSFEIHVEHNNHVKELTLYVVKTQEPTLFGRDWLHQIQLDWKRICAISKEQPTQDTQKKLEKCLDEFRMNWHTQANQSKTQVEGRQSTKVLQSKACSVRHET